MWLKKPATILLLTVFCNSLCYYGYLSCALLKAKWDARLSLAKIDPRAASGIVRVPVCLLQKDESDEVWYKDKLYDVVERDRINDTLYVFLQRDEEEQNVLTRQQKFVQDNYDPLSAGGHELTATKLTPTTSDTEYIPKDQRTFSPFISLTKPSLTSGMDPLAAIFSQPPSPPPKTVFT
jgi:hypothetical protein